MKTTLTIKNYRCFNKPTCIDVDKGFTAFVGLNNSGKSAVMRFLLEFRNLFSLLNRTGNFINSLKPNSSERYDLLHVVDPLEVFSNLNTNGIEFSLEFKDLTDTDPKRVTRATVQFDRNLVWKSTLYIEETKVNIENEHNIKIDENILRINGHNIADLSDLFHVADNLSKTLYIGPFRNTINVGTNTNYLDIQVGEAFIKEFRRLKSGNTKSSSLAIGSLTEDMKHIFEFDQLDIGPSDDDKSLHIVINGKPYKSHELGSGLMQFILVLANVSVKKPEYVLIDEPELNLHPSLQLDFLTSLGKYTGQGVWYSTHSIGLARSAADRVYSVLKKKEGESELSPLEGTPRLAEFLGEMSFSAHKELGFEKVLLVEGPSEIKVFQILLRRFSKDHKVVLLPLSGRISSKSEEELSEILRITRDVKVVIDSEKDSETSKLSRSREAFVSLCKKLKIPCHVLKYRATENYFTDSAVKNIFGEKYRALNPYEKLEEVDPHWDKNQNWRLANEMSLEEVNKTDLGKFLEKIR